MIVVMAWRAFLAVWHEGMRTYLLDVWNCCDVFYIVAQIIVNVIFWFREYMSEWILVIIDEDLAANYTLDQEGRSIFTDHFNELGFVGFQDVDFETDFFNSSIVRRLTEKNYHYNYN